VKVLLLHAWPLDERMWDAQVTALEEAGHEPVAPRLYGRGGSIDGWAGQLLGEIEGSFVAVGASMGGYCALALARRASERVPGLALVGSRADADSAERRESRDELIARLRAEGVPPEHETDVPAEELAVAQEAIRDRPDLSDVASSFGGPLLVCVGDADEIVPVEDARAIAEAALLGSLEVFTGAGHLLSVDQPERFTEVLLEFLGQWTTA
jgi:pimeloyl-ACP methyl ester carboxylesterase